MSATDSKEERTVTFKQVDGTILATLQAQSLDPLKHLWERLPEDLRPDKAHYVLKGRILDDEWLTLEEAFQGLTGPVVYVVRKRTESKTNSPANRANPARPIDNVPRTSEEGEARCRICYSSENEPQDRLFRPCLCKGSVGRVHVSCLNAWRERADNPEAYFRCSNCGYQYRISRTWFARILSLEELATAGTILCMIFAVCIIGLISALILPISLTDKFFDVIEWEPPDADYPFVRHIVFGLCCVGLSGFLSHLATMITFIRDHGSMEAMFGLGLSLTANGARGVRIFCACGLAVTYGIIFQVYHRLFRQALTEFGERVLEVTDA